MGKVSNNEWMTQLDGSCMGSLQTLKRNRQASIEIELSDVLLPEVQGLESGFGVRYRSVADLSVSSDHFSANSRTSVEGEQISKSRGVGEYIYPLQNARAQGCHVLRSDNRLAHNTPPCGCGLAVV